VPTPHVLQSAPPDLEHEVVSLGAEGLPAVQMTAPVGSDRLPYSGVLIVRKILDQPVDRRKHGWPTAPPSLAHRDGPSGAGGYSDGPDPVLHSDCCR